MVQTMQDITPLSLFSDLFVDLEELNDVSLNHDLITVHKRFESEGLPFLTQTLPKFGDLIFQSLNLGTFQRSESFHFRLALPRFLCGLTSRVFDENTGILKKDPCYVAAYSLRQICYLLSKYEVPYSLKQATTALKGFLECDTTLDEQVSVCPYDVVLELASSILEDIFEDVQLQEFNPRMGPGSTNRGPLPIWAKLDCLMNAPDELFNHFSDLLVASPPHDALFTLEGLSDNLYNPVPSPQGELHGLQISRVSLVPKNGNGPRVIGAEPPELMWLQLGLGQLFRDTLDSHPLTKGKFNFADQSVNASLALDASKTGRLATLDLSAASDRVSLKLCRRIMPCRVMAVIERLRCTHTAIPKPVLQADGTIKAVFNRETTIKELSMVATMGNGFTFPLEAIVFWAICVATIAHRERRERELEIEPAINRAARMVHVYGDDIICPVEHVQPVVQALETYGFRVNRNKSYWSGPFRESCGVDAFQGVNISPLRIKKVIADNKLTDNGVEAYWDYALKWRTVLPRLTTSFLTLIENTIGCMPVCPEGVDGIGLEVDISTLKHVTAGSILRKARVFRYLPAKSGVWLSQPHQIAPSDGYVTRVLRMKTPLKRFPEQIHGSSVLVEEVAYLRWMSSPRQSIPSNPWSVLVSQLELGDVRTFSDRNTAHLSWEKIFIS